MCNLLRCQTKFLVVWSVVLMLLLAAGDAIAGVTKLVPDQAPDGAAFGSAVAVQEGGFAVIGAPKETDASGRQAGAAYVTTADGAMSWRLTPSDAATRYQFGRAVAVEGYLIAVGAGYATYLFRFDPTNEEWVEEAKLEGHCSEGRFGTSVAVSGDRLLVGSPLKGCLDASVEGYVFFYQHAGNGVWELARRITSHYGTVGSYYGWSVSMEGDMAAVGAPGWGEVFSYRHDGVNWQVGDRIADPIWGSARSFGRSVSFQGGRLVVGTPGDGEVIEGAGAAYVYRQTETGSWIGEAKLLPPPTSPAQKLTGAYYGSTVGISGDLLVMGGPQADVAKEQDGAVLVFALIDGSWRYRSALTAYDAGSYDYLGTGLGIDNGVVLAGAPGHDGAGPDVGAAYLFTVDSGEQPPPDDPPPPNQMPTASFTYECMGLTCHFDASGSSDPDGTIVDYAWTFGDNTGGNGEMVWHTYASSGYYDVYLRVTDDGGKAHTVSQTVSVSDGLGIELSATGYKVRGLQKARLTWSNAASANVDVYRNNARIATTANSGSYTDNIDARGRGTYVYRVCEEGTNDCSNQATVVFD